MSSTGLAARCKHVSFISAVYGMPLEDGFSFCNNEKTDLIIQASKLQASGPQAGLTLCNYCRVPIQVPFTSLRVFKKN